jgi:VWFA-related protein
MRLTILGFLLPIAPALALLQTDEFRISTNVFDVLLDVSVRDAKGGYVSGLKPGDFRVEEDGVPQTIAFFSDSDVPVTVGLVIDDSGSMRPKRSDVIAAGLEFINASNPRDETFVINFNDKVRMGLPPEIQFSDDYRTLATALSNDRPAGRTTLYDAIAAGLHHLEMGTRERKTLVIVSDGGDNASLHTRREIMQMIEESHATIYTVGLFEADDPDRNPRVLQSIASVSGGEAFLPERYEDVIPICRKIAEDIRNRYTIGYVPSLDKGKTGLRRIHVTAMAPHHGHLIVQSRTSYLTPDRP